MPKHTRSVLVSELVRRDQELSGSWILPDEIALQALCTRLNVRTPSIRRPFAIISDDDVSIKSMVSNNYGGQMPVYHRIPVFSQMPATDQQPVTEIRHNRLLQRPMVVQLHRLRPNDPALQDKLNQAVATRLWEPVRSKRAAALDALGFAATAGTIASIDYAMYSHDVDGYWIMYASGISLMAGTVGTLNMAEASKPALPQLPSGIDPPLRLEYVQQCG